MPRCPGSHATQPFFFLPPSPETSSTRFAGVRGSFSAPRRSPASRGGLRRGAAARAHEAAETRARLPAAPAPDTPRQATAGAASSRPGRFKCTGTAAGSFSTRNSRRTLCSKENSSPYPGLRYPRCQNTQVSLSTNPPGSAGTQLAWGFHSRRASPPGASSRTSRPRMTWVPQPWAGRRPPLFEGS